jgi:amino acid permease
MATAKDVDNVDNGYAPDSAAAESKALENWLPVTGNRKAKWWYAAFHNVTAMVGAGVLGLPTAMQWLTWGPGVVVLILSWVITLYTLWQMVEMHEIVPGKRFDRYHELGQQAFGEKLGLWIVVPQQLIVQVGVDIVYMVTGGRSLQNIYILLCKGSCPLSPHISLWIFIFGSVHFFLSQLPNFNSVSGLSLAAAIMSLSYSTIAWGIPAHYGHRLPGTGSVVAADYHLPPGHKIGGDLMNIFNALGTVAFAYAGHNVVLEIQATIPSTPEKPSKIPMWRGVVLAYIVVAACYFPVSIVGYWAYGNNTKLLAAGNILTFEAFPVWLVVVANFMVIVHVMGSYQIYAMPVFDTLETVLVKRLHFAPSLHLRIVTRSLYVIFTMFVGITFPFFSALLGFFGGFAFAPTTYFLPCIMWLCIVKPKPFSLSWITNWICIIIGVLLMFAATIGGMANIIVSASTYKFYA